MSTSTADTAKTPETKRTLPAWKVILRMIRYRRDLWLGNLAGDAVPDAVLPDSGAGLARILQPPERQRPDWLNLWTIVALLFCAEIGSVLGMYGLITTNVPFFMNTMTLLRKNLLRHILRRPGASALPDSPGEAISRFRGDTFEIPLFALWINDLMGSIAFNIIALIVMVRISPTYTGLALLPFIVVGVIAAASTKRIDEYRRASSRATGIITGFIGEFFGAVQAVKVATAEEGVIEHFNELNDERRSAGAARPAVQRNPEFHLSQRHQPGHRGDPDPGRAGHAGRHLHRGRFCPVRLLPGIPLRADRLLRAC